MRTSIGIVLVIGGVICGVLFSAGEFVILNGFFLEVHPLPTVLLSVSAITAGIFVLRSRNRAIGGRNLR